MIRKFISLMLLLAFFAMGASASTFLAVDTQYLVKGTWAVVEGEVVQTEAYWNDEKTAIFTKATFSVEEWVLGITTEVIEIVTPGGTVDDYAIEANGFPIFQVGERQLLFLDERQDGIWVFEHQQGQYHVELDDQDRIMARPALDASVRLVQAGFEKGARPQIRDLRSFKAELRTLGQRLRPELPVHQPVDLQ